jgi:hypothetical protein
MNSLLMLYITVMNEWKKDRFSEVEVLVLLFKVQKVLDRLGPAAKAAA